MRAMILAAGLGTRLGEITKTSPKCLVTVAGKPLLQYAIDAVMGIGITEIAINLHHHADQVRAFLRMHNDFGAKLHLVFEDSLLDTGGGVLNCAEFLSQDTHFIVHNADVFSHIPLGSLCEQHLRAGDTATLAVQHRTSSRGLLFDSAGELRGRFGPKGEVVHPGSWGALERVGFGGISVAARSFLADLQLHSSATNSRAFSIIDGFLAASSSGHRVGRFVTDQFYWADVGTPEKLAAVEEYLAGQVRPK